MVGLIEWAAAPPWPRLSNPLFTPGLLLAHWLAVLAGGGIFLVGYAARWRYTPVAMVAAYAAMAAVCAVETFGGYLVHDGRFRDMAVEYLAYLVILALLFRAGFLRRRFAGPETGGR